MEAEVFLGTSREIAEVLATSTKRPKSQSCRTCGASNKWSTDPPHKKPKCKGDLGCPFEDPAKLIGKQAARELVRVYA